MAHCPTDLHNKQISRLLSIIAVESVAALAVCGLPVCALRHWTALWHFICLLAIGRHKSIATATSIDRSNLLNPLPGC